MSLPIDANRGNLERRVRDLIRDVPDYPKPGIVFKDITPLLASPADFVAVTEAMAAPFRGAGVTHVVAIESRGFIFGAPVAQHLAAGFVPVRKSGKLPFRTRREEYALEYGTDVLEIHDDCLTATSRVLVVDDVLATGGTAAAAGRLVAAAGGVVVGFSFLLALGFLPGIERLGERSLRALVTY